MEVASSSYRVQLSDFEGPLDLLLHLVREAKLDITEISLAQVAQQYFSYLESMQQLNVELESSYLVVFAQLLELKSRLLLPFDESEGDEVTEEAWQDGEAVVAPSLVKRLTDYAAIKEAAVWLSRREKYSLACYPRPLPMTTAQAPELEVSLTALVRTMRRLERSTRAPRAAVAVAKIALSVPERIEQLWELMQKQGVAKLSEILGEHPPRDMIIVTFLALLELARNRKIAVLQEVTVGEIRLEKIKENE